MTDPPAALLRLVERCRQACCWTGDVPGETTEEITYGTDTGTWIVTVRFHGEDDLPPHAVLLVPEVLRAFDAWSGLGWELHNNALVLHGTVGSLKIALIIEAEATAGNSPPKASMN